METTVRPYGNLAVQMALFTSVRVFTLFLIFTSAVVLGSVFQFRNLSFPFQGIMGLALILISKVLDYRAIKAFGEAGGSFFYTHAPEKLVTWGPYRRTRNPLYITLFADTFALFLIVGSVMYLILLAIIVVGVHRTVVRREEPRLSKRFGDAYLEYKAKTPRWI